jgi:predicted dehydrogenase/nucleoside-diphosphate-sugar epimerase
MSTPSTAPPVSEPRRNVAAGPGASPRRPSDKPLSVGIVGGGYIAGYHLTILRGIRDVRVTAACEPNAERREALRAQWQIPHVARSVEEMLRESKPDVVHILVPPALHFELAEQALRGGAHVLVEKPMVLSTADCDRLLGLASERGLRLGVNHNVVHHPMFQRLLRDVRAKKLGRVEHVVSVNNLPLGQLEGGQHDHWMFQAHENVLFEQGPHPLSQVCALLGEVLEADTVWTDETALRTGATCRTAWQATLRCARGTASMFLSFGRGFPTAVIEVIGQDGAARLDLLNNMYALDRRTRRAAPLDVLSRGLTQARQTAWCAAKGALCYGLSTLRLMGRSDPYYRSMKGAIEAFYAALLQGEPDPSTEGGRFVTAGLELMARGARPMLPAATPAKQAVPAAPSRIVERRECEVLVLGGTGFIGRHLVKGLVKAGHAVRLMVRKPALVPAVSGAELSVCVGDIRNPADVERAVQGCRAVIHLVAGAPEGWAEVERLFVGGTRNVAEACLKAKVPQLLFASSICAYYRGENGVITEETPIDPQPEKRCDYARAKIACERLLGELHAKDGLQVTIFRPGIVVGEGSPVEHLGVGTWAGSTHCVSWGLATGRGLPFVLAEDVADALVRAVGKPGLEGKSFNLVGDVRLSAREYIDILREETGRDIQLHRRSVPAWAASEFLIWLIKVVGRKPNNTLMRYRELAYRSAPDAFDCGLAKRLLGWSPVADRDQFIERGIRRALAPSPNPLPHSGGEGWVRGGKGDA